MWPPSHWTKRPDWTDKHKNNWPQTSLIAIESAMVNYGEWETGSARRGKSKRMKSCMVHMLFLWCNQTRKMAPCRTEFLSCGWTLRCQMPSSTRQGAGCLICAWDDSLPKWMKVIVTGFCTQGRLSESWLTHITWSRHEHHLCKPWTRHAHLVGQW